ncbi:MAG: toprim domain-containing protein [Hyphomonadaceae bacterium]
MTAEEIVRRLNGKWSGDQALARCPVRGHGKGRGDLSPSLSIAVGDSGRPLLHCFAGCRVDDILAAVGSGEEHLTPPIPLHSRERQSAGHKGGLHTYLWSRARPACATPVAIYLRSRGITLSSDAIRFLPDAKHPTDPTRRLPAMLAAITSPEGSLCAVQCTYLHPSGAKAAVEPGRKTFGRLGGGAVRLSPATERLALAEGVETAFSATQLFDMPAWAACGTRFDKIRLPPVARQIIMMADHDAAGLTAALAAGHHFRRLGLQVEVYRPRRMGWDWNDVLQSQGAKSEAPA